MNPVKYLSEEQKFKIREDYVSYNYEFFMKLQKSYFKLGLDKVNVKMCMRAEVDRHLDDYFNFLYKLKLPDFCKAIESVLGDDQTQAIYEAIERDYFQIANDDVRLKSLIDSKNPQEEE